MIMARVLPMIVIATLLFFNNLAEKVKPRENQELTAVKIAGDLILGGLFPVHEKGERTACGPKVYNRGVQRLEAMLFAIDRINRDSRLLHNIKLGVHILDTCSRDTYGLNQSIQFVRSSLDNLDTTAFECLDKSKPTLKNNMNGPIVGVVGGSYSSVSLQVANLLQLFRIPQISPASTAKALSDKSRFYMFARTVPPDTYQSIALVDIVKKFNWSYVSTVHSEGSYGEYGIEAFHREASQRNVCIAVAEKVPSTANDSTFDGLVVNLQKKPNSHVVILFTRAEDSRSILLAAQRAKLPQPFQWIASDGWGKQQKLVEGIEKFAEGAITVELQSEYVPEFDKYMMSLTPETNSRNPWFEEFWEETFNCVLEKNFPTKFKSGENLRACDHNLRLSREFGYEQESKTQFVIDAVYALVHGLHNLHFDVCLTNQDNISDYVISYSPVCPEMIAYDGKDFYEKYLLDVSFYDMVGRLIQFDAQGDVLPRYDILNYQKSHSGYEYRTIGRWSPNSDLKLGKVIWNGRKDTPISACSLPCAVGMIKKQQGDTCCWICDSCEVYEYVVDEFTCRDCGPGLWPHPDKLSCTEIQVEYIRWESVFAIGPIVMAIVGIVMTVVITILLIKNRDTPLIRASGRELNYMLLFGILLSYCNTFALLAQPTIGSCILQRFGIGVGFSIIYGSLLTKTNRISRIFDSAAKSAQPPKYISPQSQVLITLSFIGIQVIITMIWLVIEPPGIRLFHPNRSHVILKCKIQDMSFVSSQLYNMILITICTVFAIKTRKIPENFNESKFIGFTMYTTCIIWLAFIPIYFGTENSYEIQITTLAIAISMSATVALVCLYSPKAYILVFHPEKNVRKLTMNSAAFRPSGTYRAAHSSVGTVATSQPSSTTIAPVVPTIHESTFDRPPISTPPKLRMTPLATLSYSSFREIEAEINVIAAEQCETTDRNNETLESIDLSQYSQSLSSRTLLESLDNGSEDEPEQTTLI